MFFTYSRTILRPFKDMIGVMRQVQHGNLKTRFAVHGQDEVAQLGGALNRMIAQLDELIDSEYRTKLSLRNAEYRALQSQIQPHFLYNTLNGFIGLNRRGRRSCWRRRSCRSAGQLRYILMPKDLSSLGEEFEVLAQYCELQKMRFG
ncbi:histidine kinase [Paenibacillus sp. P26]|nr:histidine kinase [Paenibacillus sp. P26]